MAFPTSANSSLSSWNPLPKYFEYVEHCSSPKKTETSVVWGFKLKCKFDKAEFKEPHQFRLMRGRLRGHRLGRGRCECRYRCRSGGWRLVRNWRWCGQRHAICSVLLTCAATARRHFVFCGSLYHVRQSNKKKFKSNCIEEFGTITHLVEI